MWTLSMHCMECGLRYVKVSCDIVDRSRVITHGKRSSVISTLPVTTDGSLKGTLVHYKDIEGRVTISKGAFNVRRNDDCKFVGSVPLGLYIM